MTSLTSNILYTVTIFGCLIAVIILQNIFFPVKVIFEAIRDTSIPYSDYEVNNKRKLNPFTLILWAKIFL